jgi:indolepyruvate decarboxylase
VAGTVGDYLIERLAALGVRHVFGVPGDFVLGFYDALVKSPIEVINTCDEQGAGFAADAYARVNGIGCVCVTYAVGGLKVSNPPPRPSPSAPPSLSSAARPA